LDKFLPKESGKEGAGMLKDYKDELIILQSRFDEMSVSL